MITLCTFGPILENSLSAKKFLGLYFATGIGASLLYLLYLYFFNSNLNFYNAYITSPNPEFFSAFLKENYEMLYNSYYGFIYDFLRDSSNPVHIDKSIAILKHLCSIKFDIPIVGASGAIFGLLASFAILFPRAKICLLFLPIPVEAQYFVVFYGMYELVASLRSNPGDNVAHLAHLGGILIAYIYLKIFNKKFF
jgi:membrane associated rhomboid family serine protease